MRYQSRLFRRYFRATNLRFLAGAGFITATIAVQPVLPLSFEKPFGKNIIYTEFSDPYYFSSGLYMSLLKSSLPTLDSTSEKVIYRHLLSNLFSPNCFLVEIGVYPLPLAGAAAKAWAPRYYKRAKFGNTNVVRTLTESIDFKEPWSLSIFLGNSFFFKQNNQAINGQGNIGFLCTYGYYHIKDNSLYPDHWGEFEAKLKLDKDGTDRRYAISYRIGARLHSNQEIKDFAYLGFKRDRTDFSEPSFSFYKNTNVQLRADYSMKPFEVLAFSIEAGKKKPFKLHNHTYAVGLSVGVTWNLKNAYTGELGKGFVGNSLTPIVRPMVKF
jgi:hypothetical protein